MSFGENEFNHMNNKKKQHSKIKEMNMKIYDFLHDFTKYELIW